VDLGTGTGGSGARVQGIVYHNTGSGVLWVLAGCQSTTSGTIEEEAITDSSSTPTTVVDLQSTNAAFANVWVAITFPVISNNYYKVVNATGCGSTGGTGTKWFEWH
jgi:hypothetical protein